MSRSPPESRAKLHSPEVDYRAHPELYRVGRGEQGVLTVQPYKTELLPLWRFRTPAEAERSAAQLFRAYLSYRRAGDFVGMDMARKFLQMGFTRASRYAHHAGGRKYARGSGEPLPPTLDAEKAASAAIFKEAWDRVRADPTYQARKAAHPTAPPLSAAPSRRAAARAGPSRSSAGRRSSGAPPPRSGSSGPRRGRVRSG